MKRDCGEGELIPCKWEVVYCIGPNDKETVVVCKSLEEAKTVFDKNLPQIQEVICSNIRLYALDKEGYANCLLSYFLLSNGSCTTTDRLNENSK